MVKSCSVMIETDFGVSCSAVFTLSACALTTKESFCRYFVHLPWIGFEQPALTE